MRKLLLALLIGTGLFEAQTAPPSTDIFLAGISGRGNQMKLGKPENVNKREGYDNQPYFLPDGNAILYTSIRNGGSTDIYRYDIQTKQDRQVTNTPEGEYSATIMPGGKTFSVIRVEADSTQRLWKFPLNGGTPSLVLEKIKPVGYHAWFNDKTVLLFVLGNPPTLQLVDVPTEQPFIVAAGVGRSMHHIPGQPRMSFVQKLTAEDWTIKTFDPKTRLVTPVVRTLPGSEDYVWTPDGNTILMAKGAKLFHWSAAQGDQWQELADLTGEGIREITRLAISPKGDRLAFVASIQP